MYDGFWSCSGLDGTFSQPLAGRTVADGHVDCLASQGFTDIRSGNLQTQPRLAVPSCVTVPRDDGVQSNSSCQQGIQHHLAVAACSDQMDHRQYPLTFIIRAASKGVVASRSTIRSEVRPSP